MKERKRRVKKDLKLRNRSRMIARTCPNTEEQEET